MLEWLEQMIAIIYTAAGQPAQSRGGPSSQPDWGVGLDGQPLEVPPPSQPCPWLGPDQGRGQRPTSHSFSPGWPGPDWPPALQMEAITNS